MSDSDSSWERSMRHLKTTDKRLQQMKELGSTKSVRSIAHNAKLYLGYQKAMVKVRQYLKSTVSSPRQKFDVLRKEMGTDKSLKLGGKPIHHFKFPINKYVKQAIKGGNLLVTDKKALSVGTFKPAHIQLHQIFGGKTLGTRAQMFGKMAWGKQNAIQRHFSFQNAGDRVPLSQVKSKIAAFNKALQKQQAGKPGGKSIGGVAKSSGGGKLASGKFLGGSKSSTGGSLSGGGQISGPIKLVCGGKFPAGGKLSGSVKLSGSGKPSSGGGGKPSGGVSGKPSGGAGGKPSGGAVSGGANPRSAGGGAVH